MSDVRAGMIIAGKYRIEEPLARGGMGSVWRARHLALETPLAVKFIAAEVFALADARKRFQREARAAALLQSPHVVQIHDYGVEGEMPYLVMELLRGEDLGERLKSRDRLPREETASIVIQVARALRRAAEAGIVHRDLKPSNVFLVQGDEDEELVKVLDFGIAKATTLREDDDTRTGAIIGSPRYMSPEQARGSRLVDPRSDLWSLAVIAYRALTGQLPFQSMDMLELIAKICTETPVPPSKLDPSLDADIDFFFERALCRDPAGRFQTARELAASFAIACGQPPPSITSSRLKLRSLLEPHKRSATPAPIPAVGRVTPLPVLPPERPAEVPPAPVSAPGAASPPSGRSPSCDPTRISGRPPPADPVTTPERRSPTPAPRNPTPVPKGTPTPCPSGIDLPTKESLRPARKILARNVAAGAAIVVLLVGALALQKWWRDDAAPAVAVSAAAPLDAPHRASAIEPQVEPPRAPPPPPPATTVAPDPTTHEPPHAPPLPSNRTHPKRKHIILGI